MKTQRFHLAGMLWLAALLATAPGATAQDHQITLTMPQHWLSGGDASGGSAQVQVTDGAGQPVAGGTVLLQSEHPQAVQLATTQVTLSSQGQGSFSVTRHHDEVEACTQVAITATYGGVSTSEPLSVCPTGTNVGVLIPSGEVSALTVSPGEVVGGHPATATVSYSTTNGAEVSLSSSDPSAATVPATINVQGGTATVQVTTYPVTGPRTVTLTAKRANTSNAPEQTATLVVNPPSPLLKTLTLNPQAVVGGATVQGTVQVEHVTPQSGPVTVTFESELPGLVFSPPSLTVSSSAPASFSVETPLVAAAAKTVVVATSTAGERKARLQLNPLGFKGLTLQPDKVAAGGGTVARLWLSAPAPAQLQVQLTSNQPGLVQMPSTLTFAPGETEQTFKVMTGRRVASPVEVTIEAVLPLGQGQQASTQAVLGIH